MNGKEPNQTTTPTGELYLEKLDALERRIEKTENDNIELQDMNRRLLHSKGVISDDGKTEKERADIQAVQNWIDKGGKD